MDAETLEALEGSIKKWEAIVAGIGADDGRKNCPLCAMFYVKFDCKGCPVEAKTKLEVCQGTPYRQWAVYQGMKGEQFPLTVFDTESQRLAQAELDFLISLRPVAADEERNH